MCYHYDIDEGLVQVYLDFHLHTREYSTAGSIKHGSLKTDSKINLSFFGSRYGLLQGPGLDEVADVGHHREFQISWILSVIPQAVYRV